MVEELKAHLESKNIGFDMQDEIFIINGIRYYFIQPKGLLINDDEEFICDSITEENVIFKWSDNWFHSSAYKFELKEVLYMGTSTHNVPTKSFLGVHGAYEILNGSREYKHWVSKAKFLGVKSLGICEKDTLAGALKFQVECEKKDIKPVIGMQISVLDEEGDKPHLINIYVQNEIGWKNLLHINKIINIDNLGSPIGNDQLLGVDMEGLVSIYNPTSLLYKTFAKRERVSKLFAIGIGKYNQAVNQIQHLNNLATYLKDENLSAVAIHNAYYLESEDFYIKGKLKDISKDSGKLKTFNEHFCSNEEVLSTYKLNNLDLSKAVALQDEIADSIEFVIPTGKRHLPKYKMKPEEVEKYGIGGEMSLFWDIVEGGLKSKIPQEKYEEYVKRIETEIEVLEFGDVVDYFLITWDIVQWSRSQDILVGVGRGSAAGSLISYLMDITRVDPIEYDLLFERFLNRGRVEKSLPDVDLDFSGRRREEVKQYIIDRYGKKQFCSVGTYTNLKPKSLIKELGKLEGLEHKDLNMVTVNMDDVKSYEELFHNASSDVRLKRFIKSNPSVINDIRKTEMQPKAESVHACATIIVPSDKEVHEYIPVKMMNKGGVNVVISQWEGGELEMAGFLKEDILGIIQLDKYEMIRDLIREDFGKTVEIYDIPLDDKEVYRYYTNGYTSDIFQLGSQGLTDYVKQVKPNDIHDLIDTIALYRPGAMENGFHTEFVKRRNGGESIALVGTEEITKNTHHILLYQEQIMETCRVVGGFTLVEADDVRRAMGKKKIEYLRGYESQFVGHAVSVLGYDKDEVEILWSSLLKFAGYSFNKSHSAAYAITGYYGQWYKVNYPLQFWSTAFSFAKKELYPRFISEIDQISTITMNPVDINISTGDVFADKKTNGLYWSLNSVNQCGVMAYNQIVSDRSENEEYISFDNFLTRNVYKGSKVTKAVIENLILSGAFDRIEMIEKPSDRREMIEEYWRYTKNKKAIDTPKFENIDDLSWWGKAQRDYCGYALIDYKSTFPSFSIDDPSKFSDYGDGEYVDVAGFIQEVKTRNLKRGRMATITLDYNYNNYTIILWDEAIKKIPNIADAVGGLLCVSGVLKFDTWKNKLVVQSTKGGKVELIL